MKLRRGKTYTLKSRDSQAGKGDTKSHIRRRASELPPEILFEILSYCPTAMRLPTIYPHSVQLLPSKSLERANTLRALSQTCRSWRRFFFQFLWERVDICAIYIDPKLPPVPSIIGEDIPVSWYRIITGVLGRTSLGLTLHPEYAIHVRVLNVCLTRYSHSTVLPALIRCIESLPNLETFQVFRAQERMADLLELYFEGHYFPTVRTIILPSHAKSILKCCHNVKTIICNGGDGRDLVDTIDKECKVVEVLEGFRPDVKMMKHIVLAAQNLRSMKFGTEVPPAAIRVLKHLDHISKIELRIWRMNFEDSEILQPCIPVAKEVLRNSNGENKSLVVYYTPRIPNKGDPGWSRVIEL